MKLLLTIIFIVTLPFPASADQTKSVPRSLFSDLKQFCPVPKDFNNGCGSGWNQRLVPDNLRAFGVNFVDACASHDNCYSKCLPGGDNYCNSECKKIAEEQREGRRTKCDEDFFSAMKSTCTNAACRGMAFAYYFAVKVRGRGNFQGIEIPEDFYKLIQTNDAEKIDFDQLVNQVENLRGVPGLSQSNKLVLNIVDNRITPSLIRNSNPLKKEFKIGKDYLTYDKIMYGNIDLTDAYLGNKKFTFERDGLKSLDPNLFKLERRYKQLGQ